jgi:hypothetical protein
MTEDNVIPIGPHVTVLREPNRPAASMVDELIEKLRQSNECIKKLAEALRRANAELEGMGE